LLLAVVVVTLPGFARASSDPGYLEMKPVLQALREHLKARGTLPTDITDAEGEPLLSWRVRLLPFLKQDYLYRQFHLDEPWNSPHNHALIGRMPAVYSSRRAESGRTPFLRPVGPGALFPSGGTDLAELAIREHRPRILLVEVQDRYAVTWSKPEDLLYDPAHPGARLDSVEPVRGFQSGAVAGFADGSVRFIWPESEPGVARSLFSPEEKTLLRRLPLLAALLGPPWRSITLPAFLMGVCAIAGCARAGYRLVRRNVLSPGESLWMILGVEQLIWWCCFLAGDHFPLDLAPEPDGLWFAPWDAQAVPLFAATVVSLLPLWWYRRSPGWWCLFALNVVLWLLSAMVACFRKPESDAASVFFLTVPLVFPLCIVLLAIALSLAGPSYPGFPRRVAHWTGLLICLLPLVWVGYGVSQGLVKPPEISPFIQEVRE
jgi:hypothetical protein